jgi:16S rRNA (guanine(966)-N(2))-methyltransferase RsmD
VRIIAGIAKGRPIDGPKGEGARPTLDRVREALFNVLQSDTPESVVLDLFAGSGALALEALSRGARSAVLVDNSGESLRTIKRNIDRLGFQSGAQVLKMDAFQALSFLKGKAFDIIFLDPPYHKGYVDRALVIIARESLLAKNGVIAVETAAGEDVLCPQSLTVASKRKYGTVQLTFFEEIVQQNEDRPFPGQL